MMGNTTLSSLVYSYKQLLDNLIIHGKSIKLSPNGDVNRLYSIFLRRQISLAESIKVLLRKKQYYDACILTSSLAENFILVKYLIKAEKIQDFVDYHCIETLPMINRYPIKRDEVLKAIEDHNLKRFLTKKAKDQNVDLLNYRNYYAPWKNIQTMVEQLVSMGDQDIKALKFDYDILCSYKHSGSYTLLSRNFDVPPEHDAMIVLGTTCLVLLHQFGIVVAYRPDSLLFKNQVKLTAEFERLSECIKKVEKISEE